MTFTYRMLPEIRSDPQHLSAWLDWEHRGEVNMMKPWMRLCAYQTFFFFFPFQTRFPKLVRQPWSWIVTAFVTVAMKVWAALCERGHATEGEGQASADKSRDLHIRCYFTGKGWRILPVSSSCLWQIFGIFAWPRAEFHSGISFYNVERHRPSLYFKYHVKFSLWVNYFKVCFVMLPALLSLQVMGRF